ncbi:HU domain-containing protein [Lutibacter sp.]
MSIVKYISDLLYRYECVIVPGFGGFITHKISAEVNHFTHTFNPPSKQLSFNSHLKNNDGLLANYIATAQNTSYYNAVKTIENNVALWLEDLKNGEIELENIGSFSLNKEGKLVFEPTNTVNYLTSSFGLSTYVSPAVKRLTNKETKIDVPVYTITKENKHKTPAFIKYAATAAILLALGTVGWNQYQNSQYNRLVAKAKESQNKVEKSIQEATFIIDNPLPTITLNVAKKTLNYHIIAGAFREPKNATKKLNELLNKGYNARILGVNKWNLTQVAFESFNSRTEAVNRLNEIKKLESKDAWLLVKKY